MTRVWPFLHGEEPYTIKIKIPKYYIVGIPNNVGDTEYYLVILKYPSRSKSIQ
jgi:hypothetical protein